VKHHWKSLSQDKNSRHTKEEKAVLKQNTLFEKGKKPGQFLASRNTNSNNDGKEGSSRSTCLFRRREFFLARLLSLSHSLTLSL
jgi:hypothetical protein